MKRALSLLLGGLCLVGAAPAPAPLASYVGKYPFDKVRGYQFMSHPQVRRLVRQATFNQSVLKAVSSSGVSNRITRRGAVLASWACEPHNCGAHNWTVVMRSPAGPAAVCYFDKELASQSNWFMNGSAALRTAGGCPGEAQEVPPALVARLARS